jgi:hypothetical protein
MGFTVAELKEISFLDYPAKLCRLRYPGHPRGCPNLGRKPGCPPCPSFADRFDLSRPVYAVVNEFDLAAHILRMRLRHPKWTDRQLRNCLYWQPRARRQLRNRVVAFFLQPGHDGYAVDYGPEAGGVDVTATLRRAGIELEWPPRRIARQVALLGMPKKEEGCPVS